LTFGSVGPLSKRLGDKEVASLVSTLSSYLTLTGKKEEGRRDVGDIGLKAMIQELPVENTQAVKALVDNLTPKLLSGITENV
jgi:hypothetical protein